jgi:hypothetical protein
MRISFRTSLSLFVLGLASLPGNCQAQGFIEEVSPPVVQRGKVCRIQLRGTEMHQAVGLWTSLPASKLQSVAVVSSDADQATLDVLLAADAPLGLYGLRLGTRSGLSNVHLFLVDELPVTLRTELADDSQTPLKVTLPVCLAARSHVARLDRTAIDVQAGQRVTFEVVGNRLGKDFDPLVTIRDAAGRLLAEHDNDGGLFFDCRFEYTFAAAGTYVVEVRDARFEGRDSWHYVLRMGDFPVARVALPSAVRPGHAEPLRLPQLAGVSLPVSLPTETPLGALFAEFRIGTGPATWVPLLVSDLQNQVEVEPNHSKTEATSVRVPACLHGVLSSPGEQDWFSFELLQGQRLRFQAEARGLGSPADLELVLFNADGGEAQRVDDTGLDEGSFAYQAGKAGRHHLLIRDVARDGGPAFAYRIEVRSGPRLELVSEVAELTIPQQSFQPLPLKITRTDFQGPLELSLQGAPPGLILEPTTVPAEANEILCTLRAPESVAPGIYSLQIVARGTSGEVAISTLAQTQPLVDRQLRNVDLLLYALREDQRRLPPSLTNRIALMITPPAPFTLELPEQVVPLIRYQHAAFPLVTTRVPGFAAPITFRAKGGQLGEEAQERDQIYPRFPAATPEQPTVTGEFYTRILTQLAKHRVDLTASVLWDGQRINLTRTFTLDVRSAFEPTLEPAQVMLEPGGTARCKILANRVASFGGPVIVTPVPQTAFLCPETIEIPAGQTEVEFEIKAPPGTNPGKYQLRLPAAGFVGKYEESLNGPTLQIEIKKTP